MIAEAGVAVYCVQGHAVAVAFFVEGGVRSCEIGELMFGGEDPLTGDERRPAGGLELCRMAIPRRVYTQVCTLYHTWDNTLIIHWDYLPN